MKEITNEKELNDFFKQQRAILFFHAPWSQYAVISKMMVEHVEHYAKERQSDASFFWGVFEDEKTPLANTLVAAGVPARATSGGGGSLSFFCKGQHVRTMITVIGDGTSTVWRHMEEIFV